MRAIRTVNLEAGFPSLEEARKSLADAIREGRRSGLRALKIVHGYGSTGKGGTLCFGLRKSLSLRKKEGVIRDFIKGEDFSIFNQPTLDLIETVPGLRSDPDLNTVNEGVTVIWLQ